LPWLDKGIPVFVLEPGCASAWTDDLPDLQSDDRVAALLHRVQTFEQVLAGLLRDRPELRDRLKPVSDRILVHGHCHQKSVLGMGAVWEIFAHWPDVKVVEPDSGCCGMAGSFGYEAEHYDLSRKMADRVLIPAIQSQPDSLVIANGFSCRHQIGDLAGRKAVHLSEAFVVVGK
jgi:Fe-S oxidoreductase